MKKQETEVNAPELFTFILLCYNNIPLLYEMLRSVFQQDYPALQVIVSDDGSAGFDEDEIKSFIYANRPKNLREILVRRNAQNLGTVCNVEKALVLSRGAYVWILAADDCIVDTTAASRFVHAFQKDVSLQALCAQVELCSEDLKEKTGVVPAETQLHLLESGTALQQFSLFARECWLPAAGTCYRASALPLIWPLPRECRLIEDWPAYTRLTRKGYPIRRLTGTVAWHRHGGISHGSLRYTSATQRQYSKDLLFVYQHEVRPFLGQFPLRTQLRIRGRALLRWGHHRFSFLHWFVARLRK